MEVNICGHHVEVTPALRDYVTSRLDRIDHHLGDVTKMEVTLEVEKLRHFAKGNVYVKGDTLHAESEHEDMYAAIDGLADKLHRQAVRHKERQHKHSD